MQRLYNFLQLTAGLHTDAAVKLLPDDAGTLVISYNLVPVDNRKLVES